MSFIMSFCLLILWAKETNFTKTPDKVRQGICVIGVASPVSIMCCTNDVLPNSELDRANTARYFSNKSPNLTLSLADKILSDKLGNSE